MDENVRATIEMLNSRVEAKTRELAELKRTVNSLTKEGGGEPPYPEAQLESESSATAIRSDQFYGKSPTTAAREYLEMRGRAVPPEEILKALERGGFDFDEQEWDKKDRLRSLAISLSKNSVIFHRLPNGTYGLVKFYPEIRAEKTERRASAKSEADGEQKTGQSEVKEEPAKASNG